ncbi:MAG: DinB family protein [Pirellulales bacterium]|nr:DinB family protein [Pirellulales bacterium]
MSAADHIKSGLQTPTFVVKAYLEDLTDEDLMRRAADGINHIAWQLGHLIASENQLINSVCPGAMPDLPEGFAEKHGKETAGNDNAADFCTKAEYLKLMDEQRAATLEALSKLTEEDLSKPAPEALQRIAENVGAMFTMQGTHWMMHAGQWVVVRRQLGKPALF